MVPKRTLDQLMLVAGVAAIAAGVIAFLASGDNSFLVVPLMLLIFMALEAKRFRKVLTKS